MISLLHRSQELACGRGHVMQPKPPCGLHSCHHVSRLQQAGHLCLQASRPQEGVAFEGVDPNLSS